MLWSIVIQREFYYILIGRILSDFSHKYLHQKCFFAVLSINSRLLLWIPFLSKISQNPFKLNDIKNPVHSFYARRHGRQSRGTGGHVPLIFLRGGTQYKMSPSLLVCKRTLCSVLTTFNNFKYQNDRFSRASRRFTKLYTLFDCFRRPLRQCYDFYTWHLSSLKILRQINLLNYISQILTMQNFQPLTSWNYWTAFEIIILGYTILFTTPCTKRNNLRPFSS